MTQERSSQAASARETWDAVLRALGARIDEQRLRRFLKPLRVVALDDSTFRLEAPDRLTLTCVTEEFLPAIREVLAAQVGARQVVIDLRRTEQGELFPVARPKRAAMPGTTLNIRHTFASFVVGSSNQFAHAACLAVARQPARHYNPLFIYGGVGLGKTHLASAIGNEILATHDDAKVAYLTSEQFTTDLISSLRGDRMAEFKRRYRAMDVLIVDDVQFLAGRDRTQEEFFHTFNALHAAGRQIVLTCDKIPDEIKGLEERLRNRFQWGLIADIQPPDLETRVAILERKAEQDGIELTREAAMRLAERVASNVRTLEGALTRLAAQASLERRSISAEYVEAMLDQGALGRRGTITFDEIAEAVCERYGLVTDQLLSRRRSRDVALPRQVAMFLCRQLLDASYPRIGELFGRDHSTALHGVRSISARLKGDPGLQATVETIERRLRHGRRAS